jgi:hypothetical protein
MFFVRSVLQPWAFVSGDAHERGACFPTVSGKEQARAWIFLVGAVRQSDDWVFQVTTWYQYNLCIKYLTHQQDSNSSRTSVARICWEYMLLYCVVLICWVCPISEASRVHHSDVVSGTALELHLGAGHKAKAGTVHQSSSAAFGMQYSYKILICNIHLREIFWNVIVFNPYYGSYWIGHHLKEWSYCRCTGMPIVFLWVFHLRS